VLLLQEICLKYVPILSLTVSYLYFEHAARTFAGIYTALLVAPTPFLHRPSPDTPAANQSQIRGLEAKYSVLQLTASFSIVETDLASDQQLVPLLSPGSSVHNRVCSYVTRS
jgi:hypothetical protein